MVVVLQLPGGESGRGCDVTSEPIEGVAVNRSEGRQDGDGGDRGVQVVVVVLCDIHL